jgi:hypothetical protein
LAFESSQVEIVFVLPQLVRLVKLACIYSSGFYAQLVATRIQILAFEQEPTHPMRLAPYLFVPTQRRRQEEVDTTYTPL